MTALNEAGTGILNDINDTGVAVGGASSRAMQLNADGAPVTLPTAALEVSGTTVKLSVANSISSSGEVAGRVTLAVPHGDHSHDEYYVAKWSGSVVQTFRLPDGGSGVPTVTEITDHGVIAGAVSIGGKETAVVWDQAGTPTPLPLPVALGTDSLPHTHSRVNAGTGDDVFVGYVSRFAGNTSFGGAAVAWDAHDQVNLNERVVALPEGVNLLSATDINASGQIVGTAQTPGGTRGFVLTPVPVAPPVEAPLVTGQPQSASVEAGADAVFTAAASGLPAPTVQWESMAGAGAGATWAPISGATGSTLTVSSVELVQNGAQFRAVFTNEAGVVPTEPVTLTVTAPSSTSGTGGGTSAAGGAAGDSAQGNNAGKSGAKDHAQHLATTGSDFAVPLVAFTGLVLLLGGLAIARGLRVRATKEQ